VQTFRSVFGLPVNDPVIINNGDAPQRLDGDEVESDLDLEWAGATAPDATIKFVTSASSIVTDGIDLSNSYIVDNKVAPIMSLSYGLCEAFLQKPDIHDPPARWCAALNISERTLARLFRSGTGLTFSQWRGRACILHSLQHLSAGMPVTRIAALLGYDNPAAYTAAFKKLLGRPPTAHKPQLTP